MAEATETATRERAELLGMLAGQRANLRYTAREITDAQARQRTTVSALTLGGLVKHVTEVERGWTTFIVDRYDRGDELPEPVDWDSAEMRDELVLGEDETLAGVLAEYEKVAAATEELVASLPDLDRRMLVPEAPWNPPGATWSPREVLLWIVRETAQHSGHADIIRESLDGQKTMSL